jgi:hypothetical protein
MEDKVKLVEDFEKAVRDHENMGAQHPLDHRGIEEEYQRTKDKLIRALNKSSIASALYRNSQGKAPV